MKSNLVVGWSLVHDQRGCLQSLVRDAHQQINQHLSKDMRTKPHAFVSLLLIYWKKSFVCFKKKKRKKRILIECFDWKICTATNAKMLDPFLKKSSTPHRMRYRMWWWGFRCHLLIAYYFAFSCVVRPHQRHEASSGQAHNIGICPSCQCGGGGGGGLTPLMLHRLVPHQIGPLPFAWTRIPFACSWSCTQNRFGSQEQTEWSGRVSWRGPLYNHVQRCQHLMMCDCVLMC